MEHSTGYYVYTDGGRTWHRSHKAASARYLAACDKMQGAQIDCCRCGRSAEFECKCDENGRVA